MRTPTMAAMGQEQKGCGMSDKWDRRFLELAKFFADWSKDPSTQTGAVIAVGNRVISHGYNGFPQGMRDDPELYENRDEKYSRIIHCEINALLFAQCAIPDGATLYTWPFMSCDRCVVQMLQAGIRRFVAPRPSPDKLARWGKSFNLTRKYIAECHGELVEVEL